MKNKLPHIILTIGLMMSCTSQNSWKAEIFETSAGGNQLTKIEQADVVKNASKITIKPGEKFQKITGFGGAFTESSAYLLDKISKANREKILQLYFGENGANYSLTRTTIASCDFSLKNYTYAPVPDDQELKHFSKRRYERFGSDDKRRSGIFKRRFQNHCFTVDFTTLDERQ